MTGTEFSKLLEALQKVKEEAIRLYRTEDKDTLRYLANPADYSYDTRSAALAVLLGSGLL